ncbi:MAG: hypothetical protein A3H72_02075 [Candidatus Doudnabacteria bacterium RIFCSPLOWO2_02_FULL_48_8]|uniref:BrnT family toxin n=1 Tax=Candidatus Doudnabacteria bacterium RIFCSPHIGHO2_01_FULL_46_24 TaxID=1817825 RepID=A0A1F5NSZ8_9BACT|nr:MAG: hypothetical protein A2720_04190 [Candidatus Doudnabacteria bacterium RIFCSPHIGHO2_01_FULL_46_24]OGE94151.1 MAG: hypothetical protein A3E98_02760 [Candidatus Doudnabacteria bacterium RIFCSPHIGHO2_12_FULL_48_11]OGE95592.1 MAG: hypothetical protein A3H72_02075 [Candidatus Doudnabacteria bacterium RIFCSPLOWO2_02_FULL_48_8]
MKDPEISEPIDFEWDQYNQTKIRFKHGVTPKEAEEPFFNEKIVNFDESHSKTEQRYKLLGSTNAGRILLVVFTIRNNKIRIISARSANKKERNYHYGEKI